MKVQASEVSEWVYILVCVVAVFGAVFILSGCEPDESEKIDMTKPVEKLDRVDVQRIGVFEDNLAYEGRRGVYLIRDKQTGREYIGVSGIGISEVGSHSESQTTVDSEGNPETTFHTVEDER